MTEVKFTPGPWHWVNSQTDEPYDFEAEWDGHGCPSLRTTWCRDDESFYNGLPEFILDAEPEIEPANASLISAAPDMVNVIERILERGYVSACIEEERDDYASLVAALAKARGEA